MKYLFTFFFAFFASTVTFAQSEAQLDSAYIVDHYDKREVMIPMRDGIQLFTCIYTPKDHSKPYPIL